MTMIGKSSDEGKRIKLTTHYDRGIPMVKPEVKGILD
jgi:hypothetical protein